MLTWLSGEVKRNVDDTPMNGDSITEIWEAININSGQIVPI